MSRYTRNISSRLGRYEKQRFGGSGFGEGAYSQFDWRSTSPEDETASWHPDQFPEEAAAQEERRAEAGLPPMISSGANSGTDWGSVFSTAFNFIGQLARPAADIYMGQQARDQAEKDRKREEYRLAMEAERYSSGRSSGSQPPTKKSKTGLFIGLGIAALVAVIGVIVLVSR